MTFLNATGGDTINRWEWDHIYDYGKLQPWYIHYLNFNGLFELIVMPDASRIRLCKDRVGFDINLVECLNYEDDNTVKGLF